MHSGRNVCFGNIFKGTNKKWRSVISRGISFVCVGIFLLVLNLELLQSVISRQDSSLFTNIKETSPGLRKIPVKMPVLDLLRENLTMWPDDPLCSKYLTNFAKDIDPTYLVSFPRSGNTWTRYLIEASTGVFSGSVYDDKRVKNMGFRGEFEPHTKRSIIVTKTHTQVFRDTPAVPLHGHNRVILLIRNPAEGIPSYFSFKKMNKNEKAHFLTVDENLYNSKEFRKFVREVLPKWSEIVESILVWSKHLLVIFYEDLVQDPLLQVHRIVDFLGIPEDPERMKCLATHINGPAKRDHKKIDPLNYSEKKYVAHALAKAMGLLTLRGIKFPRIYKEWVSPLNIEISIDT